MSVDALQSDDSSDRFNENTGRPTRAAKACRRCHRKKLRCHGGHPCSSCKKAHQSCDFGESSSQPDGQSSTGGAGSSNLDKRFNDLENLVHNLLSKISPQQETRYAERAPPYGFSSQTMLHTASQSALLAEDRRNPGSGAMDPSDLMSGMIHRPADPVHIDFGAGPVIPISPSMGTAPMPGTETSAFAINVRSPPTPSSLSQSRDRHQGSAEGRLALLARVGSQYSAPLRPLAFQPAHWENADHTRPPSPSREDESASQGFWQSMEVRPSLTDDPLKLGWIDQTTSDALVTIFMTYCHPFLPILELSSSGQTSSQEVQAMGSFLFTTVLAIAARYNRRQHRPAGLAMPDLETDLSTNIRRLAYAHFASSMFRRHQSLRDLQAAFLLAGWGLHPTVEGPEAWMTTGHCGRLALRLGLHRLGKAKTPVMSPSAARGDWKKLVSQWKTWLCWYSFDTSLELGFGRPVTSRIEPDEDAFLPIVEQMGSSGDRASCLYLIGLTKLTRISKSMWTWSQMLADEGQTGQATSDILPLLTELNGQLDQWTSMWLWIGSPHYLRLGRHVRLLKLQSEHVRLCLNALALKEAFAEALHQDGTFDRNQYVHKAAMAALDILQAFCESVGSDYHLVFCIDYITLIIGHALVFLIRLYMAPRASPIDSNVLLHYLDTATEMLESSDMSVLGQGTHVSRTCRELCRLAQVPLPGIEIANVEGEVIAPASQPEFDQADFFSDTNLFGEGAMSDAFDLNTFLGVPSFDPAWDPLSSM